MHHSFGGAAYSTGDDIWGLKATIFFLPGTFITVSIINPYARGIYLLANVVLWTLIGTHIVSPGWAKILAR
jgi:hypothetical protein